MLVPVWVIDTNVLISAALTAGGTCDQILRAAMDGKIRLAWNSPMLAEYRAVLTRPKFQFSPATVASLLAIFDPEEQVDYMCAVALPDPDDLVFLAAAMATSDRILITGNGAHFPSVLCLPVQILTPWQALQLLSET
jgi:putative PIN family toxin of toxin-antitoxin system